MRTIELIAQQVIAVDPALRCEAVLNRMPSACVTPRKFGCAITIALPKPDAIITPNLVFEFDGSSRLIAAFWHQMFNDMNSAADVFETLDPLVRRRMPFPPTEFRAIGRARTASQHSYSWSATGSEQVHLQMTQPRPRTLGREVTLRHRLHQPHALVAATPALWATTLI